MPPFGFGFDARGILKECLEGNRQGMNHCLPIEDFETVPSDRLSLLSLCQGEPLTAFQLSRLTEGMNHSSLDLLRELSGVNHDSSRARY